MGSMGWLDNYLFWVVQSRVFHNYALEQISICVILLLSIKTLASVFKIQDSYPEKCPHGNGKVPLRQSSLE